MAQDLKTTPLTAAHRELGARMVEFGGYEMPVQYPRGILKEHLWTREHAGAFDVSHMGPAFLDLVERTGEAEADHRAVAALVEAVVCGDIAGLNPGQLRYTLLLNEDGGIVDDLMVGRPTTPEDQGRLYIVVNAGTKDGDFARLAGAAGDRARLARADDRALIALQGPAAAQVLERLMQEAKRNATRSISLRVPIADLEQAREIAERTGVGYQTVLKQAIREGLKRAG